MNVVIQKLKNYDCAARTIRILANEVMLISILALSCFPFVSLVQHYQMIPGYAPSIFLQLIQ